MKKREGPAVHRPPSFETCYGCAHFKSQMRSRSFRPPLTGRNEDYWYCTHPNVQMEGTPPAGELDLRERKRSIGYGAGMPPTPSWCPFLQEKKDGDKTKEISSA